MREFRYSALTSTGQTITGLRQAPSTEALVAELMGQGLVVLKSRPTLGALGTLFSPSRRIGRRELRDFTQHMATCLPAGIPAVAAIDDFRKQSDGAFGEILTDIRNDISSGTQLDESFARHPEVFSPVYLALVAAGQNSGALDSAFLELVKYLEWNDDLRSQTSQAMIYPSILFVAIIGLFLLMMLFVIPRFSAIFEGLNVELPTLTLRVMAAGRFMGRWWWLIFGAVGALAAGFNAASTTRRGSYLKDRMLLKSPVVGTFMLKLALSRFSKTFAMIFGAGVDLIRSLKLVAAVAGNQVMAAELEQVSRRVASGESLTVAFNDTTLFPPLLRRLISVGEKTGSLDSSLRKASEYLDKEIPEDLKRAFTIFEAVVIALLGVMVCVAALSLLMPIMSVRAGM